jgi:hypothetical protein
MYVLCDVCTYQLLVVYQSCDFESSQRFVSTIDFKLLRNGTTKQDRYSDVASDIFESW